MNFTNIRRKLLLSVTAILIIFTLFSTEIAFAAKFPTDALVLEKLNIRRRPRSNATIDFRLEQGTIIKLLSQEGKFYKIEYNGRVGYAQKDFIQIGTKPTATPEPEKYRSLSFGSYGYEVEALQEALTELRYYNGKIDGKFGKSTKDAIIQLQKTNKLSATGIASDTLQKLIYDNYVKNKFKSNVKVKTLPPIQGVTMVYGSRGQAVSDLQKRLKELGYYQAEITREFDAKTRSAVTRFQNKNAINRSKGKADADTQALIYSKIAIPADVKPTPVPTKTPPMPTEKLVRGKRGKQVTSIQKMLIGLGYYEGKITSVYDNKTIAAVKDFQKRNKLKADGVAGTSTLNLLYSTNALTKSGNSVNVPIQIQTNVSQNIQYPTIDSKTRTLKEGSSGTDVSYMQTRLTELGYYRSRNDGKFMSDDRAALMLFQRNNGLKSNGIADVNTLQILYSTNAIINTNSQANTSNPSRIDLSLRMGMQGEAVRNMQEKLISLGYLKQSADGKFGKATYYAVKSFQRANKLQNDGIAGAITLGVLNSKGSISSRDSKSVVLKKGDNSPAVKDMQELLINFGYLNGVADGKFGPATQLALIRFQTRNNLKRDGIAGTNTLNALKSQGGAKLAPGVAPTPKPEAMPQTAIPMAANVRYENWYTYIRALCRKYPNISLYDYSTGISWQIRIFSTGSHADGVPITAQDTDNMNRAFGKTTWTPKPVWVTFSDGSVFIATTHNTPHGTYNHNRANNFPGHTCIHFPRTLAQVQAIGPYATSHQTAVDIGWQQTQQLK